MVHLLPHAVEFKSRIHSIMTKKYLHWECKMLCKSKHILLDILTQFLGIPEFYL